MDQNWISKIFFFFLIIFNYSFSFLIIFNFLFFFFIFLLFLKRTDDVDYGLFCDGDLVKILFDTKVKKKEFY